MLFVMELSVRNAVKIFVVAIGAILTLTGIISGNVAANQMWDEVDRKAESEQKMFSTGETIGSGSLQGKRYDAIQKYRESNPHGPKNKQLRTGQFLTVLGFAVVAVGFLI